MKDQLNNRTVLSATQPESERQLGEIIEASIDRFTVQSYTLHEAPSFGALVRVPGTPRNNRPATQDSDIFGFVFQISTSGLEPGRRAMAKGNPELADGAVYDEHPELDLLLKTEFTALIVGHLRDGEIVQTFPLLPPPLHYPVRLCTPAVLINFTRRFDYLRTILSVSDVQPEELIAAIFRRATSVRGNDHEFLLQSGRALARLLKDDYPRLRAILTKSEI